ncbi:tocopherol polyprenyltransferase-like protein [Baffinella frigidus]|nr:tocopherol polyprenyltransferase-like protein [Cryptophyta sp. CCMP2293]
MLNALYKFSRPHTIRGTILASCACVTRVLLDCIEKADFVEWRLLRIAAVGLVALLCGNAYIVGINQIYDVDIDKVVNKPFLPVAAGEISKPMAWTLVLGTAFAGLALVASTFSSVITALYCLGMGFGTVYTVPPFRWKNNAFLAAFSIAMVRGLLLNIGLHQAASNALGLPCTWPPQVLFIASFMTVFAVVIAIAKDLPDVDGDRQFKVKTLASTWGVANAAKLVERILLGNYAMGIAVGFLAPGVNTLLLVSSHLGLAGFLRFFSSKLDPDSVPSIKLFYKNIWKLFYAEYLLFPFF